MTTPRDFLMQILDVVGFTGDQGVFADTFLENIRAQALLELVQGLSDSDRQTFSKKIAEVLNDPKAVAGLIGDQFSETQMQESISRTATTAIKLYVQTVRTTLSDDRKQKLDEKIRTLQAVA